MRHIYRYGSVVMNREGIPNVKIQVTRSNGKTGSDWIPEHRHIMQLRLGRELVEGEKAFHLDNTLRGEDPKAFNDPRNLAVIKCRTTKWVKLARSRVLFEPKKEIKLRQYAAA